jgi:uncharacterized small protein (DUF1192 family)
MIRQKTEAAVISPEPEEGRPERTGEDWLGRGRSQKKRLWERLNPRHRHQVRLLAEALALEQVRARLPEEIQARLAPMLEEIERLAARARKLLAELAGRTRRPG